MLEMFSKHIKTLFIAAELLEPQQVPSAVLLVCIVALNAQ